MRQPPHVFYGRNVADGCLECSRAPRQKILMVRNNRSETAGSDRSAATLGCNSAARWLGAACTCLECIAVEESTLRLGGQPPLALAICDEMLHECVDLLRYLHTMGKLDRVDRGAIEHDIAGKVRKLSPDRWGEVLVELAKDHSIRAYNVHFVFGGLLHTKRGGRVSFSVSIPQDAITNGF